MAMFRRLLSTLLANQDDQRVEEYRDIIRHEAIVGGRLFGEIHPKNRREFFCLDEHTWVWHEEWVDEDGRRHTITTRYDVRPNGVVKAQNNESFGYIDLAEAQRLYHAVSLYNQHVDSQLYGITA
jgi:hypothetical protein